MTTLLAQLAAVLPASSEELRWQDHALCAEVGGDLWFPDLGEPTAPAKQICRRCTVTAECLKYALRIEEGRGGFHTFGIWGGLTVKERRELRKQTAASLDPIGAAA